MLIDQVGFDPDNSIEELRVAEVTLFQRRLFGRGQRAEQVAS
jgi:hypothetical protein